MFLHSGAALHRHEYSAPLRDPKDTSTRRPPLARPALSASIVWGNRAKENPLPLNLSHQRRRSDYTSHIRPAVRFQEPEAMDEDNKSVNSDLSASTSGQTRRRKHSIQRTSINFCLAHPAPREKHRLLHIRPKLLLQLQLLSPLLRPKPAIDVLPATHVVPRLAEKFPRILKGKQELGINDVMVARSENYDSASVEPFAESDSDEDGLGSRVVIAVICQLPNRLGGAQGRAEIVMSDGSVWVAQPHSSGQYEFSTVDAHGQVTIARWVRKKNSRRSSIDTPDSTGTNTVRDTRFIFSIIDPSSRRHPILGTLTPTNLEIPEQYTTSSPSASMYPPITPIRGVPSEFRSLPLPDEPETEKTSRSIDENTKTLIQVTAIWVALRESWSPYFRYNDAATSLYGRPASNGRVASNSWTTPGLALSSNGTPESCSSATGARSNRLKHNSANGSPTSRSSRDENVTMPRRSVSTGGAFMKRVAARNSNFYPSNIASSDSEDGLGVAPGVKRAATDVPISWSDRNSTIPTTFSVDSAAIAPNNPAAPQRRTQSAYIPAKATGNRSSQPERTPEIAISQPSPPSVNGKCRFGWKTLITLFRRSGETLST